MQKICLLLCSFLMLSHFSANAQILYTEDFEGTGGTIPTGMTLINADLRTPAANVAYVTDAWIIREDFVAANGDSIAVSTSWYTPAGASDDWIITPPISGLTANALLSWDAMAPDAAYADGYQVWVSTGAATVAGMTAGTMVFSTTGESVTWTQRSASLAAFSGQTVRVGFRNNSTDKFLLFLDSIVVENASAVSPEVAVTAPLISEYTLIPNSQAAATYPVSAGLTNSGTAVAAAVSVTTKIYASPNFTTPIQTLTGSATNLGIGASSTVAMGNFTNPGVGAYLFEQIISGNTGVTTNDTAFTSLTISDNFYARDNGTPVQGVGGPNTISLIIGNNYEITANTNLDSVLFFCAPGGPGLGDTCRLVIGTTTAGVPNNTGYIGQSANYIFTVADTTGGVVLTLPVTNMTGGALSLTPGTYFVGLESYTTADNYGLQCTADIFTANTVYANINNGTYSPLNALLAGFDFTPIIRPYLSPACNVIATTSSTNATCTGGNGSATVTPTGGTAPYTYTWSNAANTATANNLTAATYTVTVTDASSCSVVESVTVSTTSLTVTASNTTTNSNCGASTGSATVTPTNGTAPYTYVWSNAGNTQTISNVGAGSYSATITDANGCTGVVTGITVNNPNAPTASVTTSTNVSCNGDATGSATASGSGGTAPYTYTWSNSAATITATGLMANVYTVTVTDAASCAATSSITITEPTALTAATNATATMDVACNGGNDGMAGVTAAGGVAGYTYMWGNNATTANITGLTAGTYMVTVMDANSCNVMHSVTVGEPAAALSAPATHTDVSCNGGTSGSAAVTAAGGTAPYSYTWSNAAITASATGLAANTYTVTVVDANGCIFTPAAITITEPSAIAVGVTATDASSAGGSDGSVNIAPSGGTAPYTYLWSNGATTEDITGVVANAYSVTITDANGCTDVANGTVLDGPIAVGMTNANININVFPNPVSDKAILNIELVNMTDVNISISNVVGQVMQSINAANVINNQFDLDMSEWASGVYFVRVTAGEDTVTYRLTKK